jgi:hypothetical protein
VAGDRACGTDGAGADRLGTGGCGGPAELAGCLGHQVLLVYQRGGGGISTAAGVLGRALLLLDVPAGLLEALAQCRELERGDVLQLLAVRRDLLHHADDHAGAVRRQVNHLHPPADLFLEQVAAQAAVLAERGDLDVVALQDAQGRRQILRPSGEGILERPLGRG